MKGRGIKLALGVALLAVLLFAYVQLKSGGVEEAEEEGGGLLLPLEENMITSLAITGKGESFTFEESEGSWKLREDEKFPVDSTKLENGVRMLEEATVERTLEGVEDLTQYGLDTPQWEISYVSEEISGTIFLGSENASTGQYYVRRNGENRVCMVDSYCFSDVVGRLYDFAVREDFPVISAAEIQEVSVTDGEDDYSYQREGLEESGNSWSVSGKDHGRESADEEAVGELNTALNSLAYQDFLDYDCHDLSHYGLDQSDRRLSIQYEVEIPAEKEVSASEQVSEKAENVNHDGNSGDEEAAAKGKMEITLLVGDVDKEGNYYVLREGSTSVYTMAGDSLDAFFNHSRESLLDKTVSYMALDDLLSLEITAGGKSCVLEMKEELASEKADESEANTDGGAEDGQEEKDQVASANTEEPGTANVMKYRVNGKEVESSVFTSFYSKLITVKGQTRDDALPLPEMEPTMYLHFLGKSGTVVEAAYYEYDEQFYLASSGGKRVLVNKMTVKSLLEELGEFMEN